MKFVSENLASYHTILYENYRKTVFSFWKWKRKLRKLNFFFQKLDQYFAHKFFVYKLFSEFLTVCSYSAEVRRNWYGHISTVYPLDMESSLYKMFVFQQSNEFYWIWRETDTSNFAYNRNTICFKFTPIKWAHRMKWGAFGVIYPFYDLIRKLIHKPKVAWVVKLACWLGVCVFFFTLLQ